MAEAKGGSWVKWLVLGCAGLILVGVLGAVAFVSLFSGSVKRSGAYQEAMDRLRAHPAAVAALGEPIESGLLISGTVSVAGPSGRAEFGIPVHGPRGEGDLYIEATKRAGRWEFELLELQIEGGERIDLATVED